MGYTDPFTAGRPTFECPTCTYRSTSATPRTCPRCEVQLQNIAVPRE
ncbi:rubrerythrin-like domain-containing protein [Halosolutus amylolyticus]|uniref:Rubrerythrin-like domain-containing protein n=2 Tax=Halosolutus amylolyticus TaxID=2932267 RepID=A0ABD5PXG1_9EURY